MIRIGVIPTNGRDCVHMAITSLLPQVTALVVVEAGINRVSRSYSEGVTVLSDAGDPVLNISRWWNLGIDWARTYAKELGADTWDVAIINDDVIVPSTWLCYVADDMRALGCLAACSGAPGGGPIIHREAKPVSPFNRLQGCAFVLAGESGLRADEELQWWYQDDKLGADAASGGGMVMFPGCNVTHMYPNGQMTADMQVQVGIDRGIFVEKMGYAPW